MRGPTGSGAVIASSPGSATRRPYYKNSLSLFFYSLIANSTTHHRPRLRNTPVPRPAVTGSRDGRANRRQRPALRHHGSRHTIRSAATGLQFDTKALQRGALFDTVQRVQCGDRLATRSRWCATTKHGDQQGAHQWRDFASSSGSCGGCKLWAAALETSIFVHWSWSTMSHFRTDLRVGWENSVYV